MEEIFETPDPQECEKRPGKIKPSSSGECLVSSVGCCDTVQCMVYMRQ